MKLPFTPFYSTALGHAYLGDSLTIMRKIPSETVNLRKLELNLTVS